MFRVPIVLLAAVTTGVSVVGLPIDLVEKTTAEVVLDVSALAGVDTELDVTIETSLDGVTGFRVIGTFDPVTEPGSQSLTLSGCDRYLRAFVDLLGTAPSASFSVGGRATLVYATPADLRALALSPEALTGITDGELDLALQADTAIADGYLAVRYALPLTAWGDDVRAKVCDLSAYRVMKRRGFDPENGADKLIVKAYDDAIAWFKGVAAGAIAPIGIEDQTPDEDEGGEDGEIEIVTEALRGW